MTYRKKTSQLPLLCVTPPPFCSQVENVEWSLALLFPWVHSSHLSCQDHDKTSQVCPSLITPSVSAGMQAKQWWSNRIRSESWEEQKKKVQKPQEWSQRLVILRMVPWRSEVNPWFVDFREISKALGHCFLTRETKMVKPVLQDCCEDDKQYVQSV